MSVWLYYSSILLCDVWTLLYFNVSHLAGRCFLVIRLNWDDAVCFRVAWLTESFFYHINIIPYNTHWVQITASVLFRGCIDIPTIQWHRCSSQGRTSEQGNFNYYFVLVCLNSSCLLFSCWTLWVCTDWFYFFGSVWFLKMLLFVWLVWVGFASLQTAATWLQTASFWSGWHRLKLSGLRIWDAVWSDKWSL